MVWKSTIISAIIVVFILFITKQTETYSRILIVLWLALCLILMPVMRTKIKSLLYRMGLGKTKILIIGAGENGVKFLKTIQSEPNLGFDISGFIDTSKVIQDIDNVKVLRHIDAIEKYIKDSAIKAVYTETLWGWTRVICRGKIE